MATMVLVHGGFCGGYVWDALVPELEALGHDVVVIDQMPSVADDLADLGGLDDDVAHLRDALDEIGGDVVLVGHSSGGLALGEVADHPAMIATVLVAAFVVPSGMSLMDMLADAPPLDWNRFRDDGAAEVVEDIDIAHRGLAHDVDRDVFASAFDRYGLQSVAAVATPVAAPTRTHPVTYVLCTDDRTIPAPAQEQMAALAGATVERLPSSHSPMLSMPDRLAQVLHDAVPA